MIDLNNAIHNIYIGGGIKENKMEMHCILNHKIERGQLAWAISCSQEDGTIWVLNFPERKKTSISKASTI